MKKNDTSNQNRERCFFTCEKNDTSNQRPQRCVSFAPKFPPLIAVCSAASHTFNEKNFTQRVFLAKKVKNISEMEWNSFVCFTVDKENGREPAKQQRKGKNRTRCKFLLCFLSELLRLSFKLKLILKPAILLKFTHFQLCIDNKQLRLLIVLGLPHILTVIYVFTVKPRYNEVSRYRKKCSLYRGLCYSEDPVITNYPVNNRNIRYSGVI